MQKRILLFAAAFVSFAAMFKAQGQDCHYVYFSDGKVWGYPKSFVKDVVNDGQGCRIVLENDSVISWSAGEVQAVSAEAPAYPQFTTFKLDDKLNDQLFRDVDAVVTPGLVSASLSGIGKYLTPLFAMDKPGAVAYVDGVEQVSGESRLRFADKVVYTLSNPNYKRLSVEKVSDEVWSEPETGIAEIPLTVDMLSTNAPSGRGEGLDLMIDDDPSTIFHSTWTGDPLYEVDYTKQVYVSVELPKSLSEVQFYYVGRMGMNKYNVQEWAIDASNDGLQWTPITTLDESDGLPVGDSNASYTSSVISLGASYRYLRFTAVRVGYKNYLCLGDFKLYEVTGEGAEPELLQPARYSYRMMPMGREVTVDITWLTDEATSVPRIDIDIDGGEMVSSKDYYLNALITFTGNGVWDNYDFQDSVKIKGRGNSSWSSYPYSKNPYRLKFAESVKPFGMKKGKNWNLIAQRQTGSLMTNPVAHKIARMVDIQTANDVIPVELYMNGEYRGSYFFTQKVGMANNSVDFEDESLAALFELDSYFETGQFASDSYYLPVNIKAPEFGEDETLLDYEGVREEFNRFETAVYHNTNFERFVDMDMLVRYMLINDLVLNTELGHPKSAYLSRENMAHMTSRYTFGPGWDFDWAYGYENSNSYCTSGATRDFFSYHSGKVGNSFYHDLLRSSEWVGFHYYRIWDEFIEKHLDELIDFVDDYYAYAKSSFVHNSTTWGDGANYDSNVANMKSWLMQRAHYIKNTLTPYPASAKEPFAYGDINGDGVVSRADAEKMLSTLLGKEKQSGLIAQADADADGKVSISDLTWVNLLLSDTQAAKARGRMREAELWGTDKEEEAVYDFDIDDLPTLCADSNRVHRANALNAQSTSADCIGLSVTPSGDGCEVAVSLINSVPYIAYTMDFVLPEGMTVKEGDASIVLSPRTESTHVMTGHLLDGNVFRVIGYSEANMSIADTEGVLFTLSLSFSSSIAGTYALPISNICFVTENAAEESFVDVETEVVVSDAKLSQAIDLGELPSVKYGDAPFALPEYTDRGLPIAYTSSNAAVATVDGHMVTVVGAGTTELVASQPGSDEVYAAETVARMFEVAKAPLKISVNSITRDQYEPFVQNYTLMFEGFVGDDSEHDLDELPEVYCAVSSDSPVGSYPIQLKGGNDNNYSFVLYDGVYVITSKYTQTIELGELPSVKYGDAPFALPEYTDRGLPIAYTSSNAAVAAVDGHMVTIVGAGTTELVASQPGSDEVYAAETVVSMFEVAKAPLKITADDITRERFIEAMPPYTLTFEGFVNGDAEDELDELPLIECAATAESSVGIYPIRLSGGSDNNYSYTLQDGVLTIIDTSGIGVVSDTFAQPVDVYDACGRMVRKGATSLEGLRRGVYIINNCKVVKR